MFLKIKLINIANLMHINIDGTEQEIERIILIVLTDIKVLHDTFPATTDSEFETEFNEKTQDAKHVPSTKVSEKRTIIMSFIDRENISNRPSAICFSSKPSISFKKNIPLYWIKLPSHRNIATTFRNHTRIIQILKYAEIHFCGTCVKSTRIIICTEVT